MRRSQQLPQRLTLPFCVHAIHYLSLLFCLVEQVLDRRLKQFPQIKGMLRQVTENGRLYRRNQFQLRCQGIVERVQKVMEELRASGQTVPLKDFAKLVGLSPAVLSRFAPVRPLLSAVVEEYRRNGPQRAQQHGSELIERVRQAVAHLRETGQRVTQRAVGRLVGLSDSGLGYYPGFKGLYRQVIEERRRVMKQQAEQREEMLLERIHEAIQRLQQQKEPLTLQNIARTIGMKVNTLRKYPRVNALFKQLRETRRSGGNERPS